MCDSPSKLNLQSVPAKTWKTLLLTHLKFRFLPCKLGCFIPLQQSNLQNTIQMQQTEETGRSRVHAFTRNTKKKIRSARLGNDAFHAFPTWELKPQCRKQTCSGADHDITFIIRLDPACGPEKSTGLPGNPIGVMILCPWGNHPNYQDPIMDRSHYMGNDPNKNYLDYESSQQPPFPTFSKIT